MSAADPVSRLFRVHARHVGVCLARTVREFSFEAAAIAYVEDLDEVAEDDKAVSVIVKDTETGVEHCFRIDLDTGESSSCA